MSDWMVSVPGKRSQWVIRVSKEMAKAMEEDGFEAFEVVNTVPEWVAALGLAPLWCFFQDVWNLPTKG